MRSSRSLWEPFTNLFHSLYPLCFASFQEAATNQLSKGEKSSKHQTKQLLEITEKKTLRIAEHFTYMKK